ncbi:MAG TPA: gamma-glutamyl-gamma-aminobutyrate hydrolase family protein [Gemmatimonadaceae bacterium]|jgi:putative glutamine amidotransferase
MTFAPFVVVTSTTETIRGRSRVRVNAAYTDALAAAGLLPMVLPPMDAQHAVASLSDIAGLVLTGGEDIDPARFGQAAHPKTSAANAARDEYELALAKTASEQRIPTLAICRGLQVMNVALGGTLVQDVPSQRPSAIEHDLSDARTERVHDVTIERESMLARIVHSTCIRTNSSHHQAIDALGTDLRIVARSDDGVIEAVESSDALWWMVAVQWHPEELTRTAEDWDRRLFDEFAEAVRRAGRD